MDLIYGNINVVPPFHELQLLIIFINGMTSRIHRSLFVTRHSKLAPPPRLKASGGPAPHTLRTVIGWWLHTTAQRLAPRNVPNTAKSENPGRGPVSADTDTATHS